MPIEEIIFAIGGILFFTGVVTIFVMWGDLHKDEKLKIIAITLTGIVLLITLAVKLWVIDTYKYIIYGKNMGD